MATRDTKTETPKFAVVVPVGREDERLATALRSLALQNADLEIALLDASGSVRNRETADAFDDILTLRLHAPDAGQAAAIREGWQRIGGNILCWLNIDDALLPGAMETVADVFANHPEFDVVYGNSVVHNDYSRVTGFHMAVEEISDSLYRTNLISQPSCFVRRRAVEDVGGIDPTLHYVMDWDLWVRLYAAGKRFRFIDEPLSAILWATGTKTASVAPRRLYEIIRLVGRHARPRDVASTVFGVLAHHLGNYTILAGLREKLNLHHPYAADKSIAGLHRDRRIADRVTMPLVNLGAGPASTIRFHFEHARNGLAALAVNGVPVGQAPDDIMTVDLPAAVPAGDAVCLTIDAVQGAGLRFIDAGWYGAGETPKPRDRPSFQSRTVPESPSHVAPLLASPVVRLAACTVTVPDSGAVRTLKQTLLRRDEKRPSERVLLHDVNLVAEPGDRIGIVGRNGVGKTTLLRLIAGIFPPRMGTRDVRGEIAPVLSLGRALDLELSLTANVSLGLIQNNRNDLYSKDLVASILDFAELSDRADTPMRRLSAGQQARFAFALSLYQEPDIMLLDEIFTIGDAGFFEKARAEIMRRLDASPILFLASHNEAEMLDVCTRALLLDDGQIVMDADPSSVFTEYHAMLERSRP